MGGEVVSAFKVGCVWPGLWGRVDQNFTLYFSLQQGVQMGTSDIIQGITLPLTSILIYNSIRFSLQPKCPSDYLVFPHHEML